MPTKQELYAHTDIALQEGRLADARSHVERLLEDSNDAVGFTLAGRVSAAQGDPVGGLAYIGEAIRLEPFFEPAYRFRALIHEQMGDSTRMMSDIRSLLLYHPTDLPMITTYIDHALRSKRYDAAATVVDAAIRRAPRVAELYNMRGLILQRGGDMEGSVAAYRCGVALKPDDVLTLNNLGTVLHCMDRSEEAEQALQDALRHNSNFEMAWYNLGNVLKDTLRFDEAISCYERAITLRPDYADAHLNLGCVLLQHREWRRGWAEYEWRWKVPDLIPLAKVEISRWTGEPLQGRRILVLAEQGNGDTLQFSRYLPLLRRLGAEVSMRCPKEMASLISRMPGADVRIVHEAIPLPPFDFHAPLMSLPALLNASYEEIPNLPYLVTEARRRAYFARKLSARKGGRLRIGVVWGGNPEQMDDHHRSAPLDQLSELWEMTGVRWISLQKGGHQRELAENRYPIEDWSEELETFDDTAALMQELDGFVSVCSSPLHLAGALGVRSVGMLCWASDWRWQREISDTPWYPSVRLVRQPERNDWRTIAAQVKAIVSEWGSLPSKRGLRRFAGKEVAETRPPATVRAVTAEGKLDLFLNDLFLTPALLTHGEYCQGEITLLTRFLKPGALIVEAGGNVGAHTLPLARIVGAQGHIHSFEPQLEANLLLRSNVAMAELGNVTVHDAALSDAMQGLRMERPSYSSVWNTGGLTVHHELGEPIDAITIDSLELERCDLIKLDVEGHERKALGGARATIDRFRPIIFVEDDRPEESVELRKLILSFGYRCYRHRASLANCSLIPLEQRQNLGTYVSVSVLGLPDGYPLLTDLIEIDEHLNIIPNRL
jgi:FkbM family methyltransferase